MNKALLLSIFFSLVLLSCSQSKQKEQNSKSALPMKNATTQLIEVVDAIKTSSIYEDSNNWHKRGLNPSDQEVITLLRKATNNFLDQLLEICSSESSEYTKHILISKAVDQLPWDELDTEEREFMADVIAPAITAAGFDPWKIF